MLRPSSWTLALLVSALATACADEVGSPDAGARLDAASPDAGAPDAATPDASDEGDASPQDAGQGDASTQDAGQGDAGSVIVAVLDRRCALDERIGLIEVEAAFGARRATAQLADRPAPWLGAPSLADDTCYLHRAHDAPCTCPDTQVCNFQGACVEPPVPAPSLALTVLGDGQTQELPGQDGLASGPLELGGDTFRLRLTTPGWTLESPTMTLPPALEALAGRLQGTSDAPDGLEITWTPVPGDTRVHTLTNINHHVRVPTFTDCEVAASTGRMAIAGEMLRPLAVSTGLEFQGASHARFAAAETPDGCVELRYLRFEFVPLF
jgi:hypothetical protein